MLELILWRKKYNEICCETKRTVMSRVLWRAHLACSHCLDNTPVRTLQSCTCLCFTSTLSTPSDQIAKLHAELARRSLEIRPCVTVCWIHCTWRWSGQMSDGMLYQCIMHNNRRPNKTFVDNNVPFLFASKFWIGACRLHHLDPYT